MLGWKLLGAGVPSTLLAPLAQDTASAVSAAGTTQGTATELTAADSVVSTVASGTGVVLSSKGAAGDEQTVYNAGANPLKVYPNTGASINQLAANTAMILQTQTACRYKWYSATQIAGFLSA